MGYSLSNDARPYHNDWNLLMNVIYELHTKYEFVIYFYSNSCYVQHKKDFINKNQGPQYYYNVHYSYDEHSLIDAV